MSMALGLAAGACAYHTNASSMPSHIKTVAIPVFENATTEYTLEQEITNAVIRTFVADNHLRVVDERRADSVLRGKITAYRNSVFGISSISRAQEYRVSISVQVTFKDQVKNREIWTDEIVQSANYYVQDVPGDSATTEVDGRKLAVARLATEILTRSVESW
jgi:outer membrane lipopolysaccharide assembly protein LptE/RlpB